MDDLVGCFLNTVVIRTDTTGAPSLTELIRRVREVVLTGLANQDVPFERVVEAVNPSRSAARHPLFQVMLSLQNNEAASNGLPGSTVEPVDDGRCPPMPFDLLFDLAEADGGLEGLLHYAEDLFDRATAERLVCQFENFLVRAASAPRARSGNWSSCPRRRGARSSKRASVPYGRWRRNRSPRGFAGKRPGRPTRPRCCAATRLSPMRS